MNNKHLFIAVGLVYLLIAVYFGLNSTITGYVVYEDKSYNFYFSNQSNFIFDNDLITIDNGVVSLVPYYNITNATNTETLNSYIDYAEYQEGESENSLEDVTSKLKSQGGEWVNFREGHKFNIVFDRNLSNNDIIRFYLKGDNEVNNVRLYICKYESCDEDYGDTNYIFIPSETSGGAWANLTLENLDEDTDKFSLRFDENASNDLRIDYIDGLHFEDSITTNTEIYYKNASIETNTLIIDGLWKYYDINFTGEIKTYYSTGENWNLLNDNNLSFINSSSIKFKFDLESDGSSSPVLSNFIVYYYGIIQEEQTNETLPENQTNITLPGNFNETNATLPDNQTNVTQPELPAPSSGGSGGGGGGGGGSSNEEIITPANNTVQTTSSNRNELNSAIGETNEETTKGSSNILGNQSVEPVKNTASLASLTGKAVLNDIRNNWGLFIILGLIVLYYIYLKYKDMKKKKRK